MPAGRLVDRAGPPSGGQVPAGRLVALLCISLGESLGYTEHFAGSQFPNQGLNPHPQQWKYGVLTTGPPGDSQGKNFPRAQQCGTHW